MWDANYGDIKYYENLSASVCSQIEVNLLEKLDGTWKALRVQEQLFKNKISPWLTRRFQLSLKTLQLLFKRNVFTSAAQQFIWCTFWWFHKSYLRLSQVMFGLYQNVDFLKTPEIKIGINLDFEVIYRALLKIKLFANVYVQM